MKNIPALDRKGYRNFAITTGSVIALIFGGFLPWVFGFSYPIWPWVLLLILVVWGLLAPATLKPVYVGWMTFALLINKITTPIILGIVFYVFISPLALLLRIFKKDPIPKKFEDSTESYRVHSGEQDHEHLERPF